MGFRALFPPKMEIPLRLWAILNIGCDKEKLNVIKRTKIPNQKFWFFADWFVGPERYSKFAPRSFLKKLVSDRYTIARKLFSPDYGLLKSRGRPNCTCNTMVFLYKIDTRFFVSLFCFVFVLFWFCFYSLVYCCCLFFSIA